MHAKACQLTAPRRVEAIHKPTSPHRFCGVARTGRPPGTGRPTISCGGCCSGSPTNPSTGACTAHARVGTLRGTTLQRDRSALQRSKGAFSQCAHRHAQRRVVTAADHRCLLLVGLGIRRPRIEPGVAHTGGSRNQRAMVSTARICEQTHCLSLCFHCFSLCFHCLSLCFQCLSLCFQCLFLRRPLLTGPLTEALLAFEPAFGAAVASASADFSRARSFALSFARASRM